MKLRTLLLTFVAMLTSVAAMAQITSGNVYRIVNLSYETVASEQLGNNAVSCSNKGTIEDYEQLWKITESANGSYTFQNVFTKRYLKFNNNRNGVFTTTTTPNYLYIADNSSQFPGGYTIAAVSGSTWVMHCDGSSQCVPWNNDEKPSNWYFEEVAFTSEDYAKAEDIYTKLINVLVNKSSIIAAASKYFTDNTGTALTDAYAAMSDEDFAAAMVADGLPEDLQEIILKIKNNSWDTVKREKEFRVYDYKPYSDVNKWANVLYTRLYSPIDNPTGICTQNSKQCLYIWVEDVPANTTIEIAEIAKTGYFGTNTQLKAGLNIVSSSLSNGFLYVRYICETDTAGAKLADYPAVKVHIENGYVNGFWSKERGHTNADWVYMQQHMFQNEDAIQAKGIYTLLNFRKKEFIQNDENGLACPEKISELIDIWDFYNGTQQKYMMLDKYYAWFNNLQLAMSDDSGFMDAGNHRTHYNNNTLTTIACVEMMMRDAGQAWGPLHEIGHNNQYAFEIVGTSEVSNNALANIVNFERGTHTSRGNGLVNQIKDFENKIPYVLRGEKMYGSKLFSMTRMYYQLFLYFHAAGKCPDFYPRLFERLRYDRLKGWSITSSDAVDANGYHINSVNAKYDQLKFAEICCEITQTDLSEFFEAWGFFIPMKNGYVGDYGHHYVYLLQEDIDASKKKMQQYAKKGGQIMFLEDRVRPSKKKKSPLNDDEEGYRADYSDEVKVGDTREVGYYGQWEDCIDESVKAEGYYYISTGKVITIVEAENAKGALGFKLYDAETGELLTYTDRRNMSIPMHAQGKDIIVAAAQADGTNYNVPSAAEGPVSLQKELLDNKLNQAVLLANNKAVNGNEIGKYAPAALEKLSQLVDAADAAYSNNDTSVHSFGEWAALLDEEYNNVVANTAALNIIKEDCKYRLESASKSKYYFEQTSGNMLISKYDDPTTNEALLWSFESTGKPYEYYMKANDGKYISNLVQGQYAYASTTSKSEAVKFEIGYTSNGRTYIYATGNSGLALSIDSKGYVIGGNASSNTGQWKVYIAEDNAAEFEETEFAYQLAKAKTILTETSDIDSIAKGNVEYMNDNIYSLSTELRDNIINLYNVYTAAEAAASTPAEYYAQIMNLRGAIAKINGQYTITAPRVIKDGKLFWYTIKNNADNYYWSSTATQVASVYLGDNAPADSELYCFVPYGNGQMNLFSKGMEKYVYKHKPAMGTSNYLATRLDSKASLVIATTFDINKRAFKITADGTDIQSQSSKPALKNKSSQATTWEIKLVSIEEDLDYFDQVTAIGEVVVEDGEINGSDEMYDIFGRKVTAPTKNNIYIKGNKKIIF